MPSKCLSRPPFGSPKSGASANFATSALLCWDLVSPGVILRVLSRYSTTVKRNSVLTRDFLSGTDDSIRTDEIKARDTAQDLAEDSDS